MTKKVNALNKAFFDETDKDKDKEKEEYQRQKYLLERGEVMSVLINELSAKNLDADIQEMLNRSDFNLSDEEMVEADIKEFQTELDSLG